MAPHGSLWLIRPNVNGLRKSFRSLRFQEENDRQARAPDCRRRKEKKCRSSAPGTFLWPYFCAGNKPAGYELTESIPGGPHLEMQKLAKKYQMVLVVPVYEVEMTGVYFNTAAVIDADGRYLGKYRKHHIPHCHPAFGKSSTSRRETPAIRFPDALRPRRRLYLLRPVISRRRAHPRLNGAEIVYTLPPRRRPLEYLWELEQPAHASPCLFRRCYQPCRHEAPGKSCEFYGKSYFCDPRGKICRPGLPRKDELLVAD